jgi:hypothetical protein
MQFHLEYHGPEGLTREKVIRFNQNARARLISLKRALTA